MRSGWELHYLYHALHGYALLSKPDGLYNIQPRFGMYRWHIVDPIRFAADFKVNLQNLGWLEEGRYLARRDDIASVAYWYQTLPSAVFPPLPDKLEIWLT